MKKTTKIFGIYADAFNGKVGQTFAYMEYFSQLGYVRMISTIDNLENIVHEIDVLVVPGGADVLSSRYGMAPGVMDGRVNQHYEYLDSVLIPQFVEAKKPIVGICRGLQTLNVYFGGSLQQHIIGHHQGENRTKTDQILYLTNKKEIEINSMHHQCINELGEGFTILGHTLAYEPTNFLLPFNFGKNKNNFTNYYVVPEVIKHNTLPIVAFQYHPEEFNCKYATEQILKLIE